MFPPGGDARLMLRCEIWKAHLITFHAHPHYICFLWALHKTARWVKFKGSRERSIRSAR